VLDALLRMGTELGPLATWLTIFIAVVVAIFVLYLGFAMLATFRASDQKQLEIRYQVFHDLLGLFHRGKHQ
jgi:hypothetical protein